MPIVIQYEQRYCAFILGFSELMKKLSSGEQKFTAIRNLLLQLHQPDRGHPVGLDEPDFRAQSISDAVAISTACNLHGLYQMLHALETLTLNLLYEGYFVRGAIVKDYLCHAPGMVFGPALIRAFHLESEVTRYPRIMVTSDVVQDVTAADGWATEFESRLKQADDGPYYVHVLRPLMVELQRYQKRPSPLSDVDDINTYEFGRFATMRDRIISRFSEAVDTPRHFEKVQWFARYWNESTLNIRADVGRISGPGLNEKAAVWG